MAKRSAGEKRRKHAASTATPALAPPAWLVFASVVFQLLRLAILGAIVVLCVYFAIAYPVKLSAGKETEITLIYRAVLDLFITGRVEIVVPYGLNVALTMLLLRERGIRKRAVTREHKRVAELEKLIDPNRESSDFKEDKP